MPVIARVRQNTHEHGEINMKYWKTILFLLSFTVATSWAASLTGPQKNAVRSAKQYLSVQGFSRNGIINQLSSEYGDGYSVKDATAAVGSLKINWNKQAARSAQNYLKLMGFSCKGLINQLSSSAGDGYTTKQATYGAKQTDAC
jgi:hypothetical protein